METNYAVAWEKLSLTDKSKVAFLHRYCMDFMPETSERHVWEQCILRVYNAGMVPV
jgi:hypothetical protein